MQIHIEIDLEPCHAAPSESVLPDAEAAGKAMTMEQAIAYALEEIRS